MQNPDYLPYRRGNRRLGLKLISVFLILEALKVGDVALVLPITQLSFTLIIVVSWLFFKEKMSIKKIIGILLAIGSVFLMN